MTFYAKSEALARSLILSNDAEMRRIAQSAITARVWSYSLMLDAGADKLDVLDQVRGDIDIFSNISGKLAKALDDVNALRDEALDLSGLEALNAQLEAETSTRLTLVRRA